MKSYNIITYGCQMNSSDSERVAAVLEKNNYRYTPNKFQADLVVINTCGVRQSAENRIYGLIPKIKEISPKTKIILTGCLVGRSDVRRRMKQYVDKWLPISGTWNLDFTDKYKIKAEQLDGSLKYLKIKPKYSSKFSACVPIGNGCDNFCSYCVVPYVRGREAYRPAEEILAEVKALVKKGYKEIILIAQNVNSYKSGIRNQESRGREQIDFADLLKMVNGIKGDFWIRFFTSHPKDISDKLIKIMADCKKVCRQIHLPAQAGDNKILKAMNRQYSVEHFERLIKKIRQAMPEASITTDLIVGFPGETRKQFENSVKLFKEIKFDMAYLAQYSPRPGTAAAKLKDSVSKKEKKRREEILNRILKKTALNNNKKYLGKLIEVLVDGKTKTGDWRGRTRTGKNVRIGNYDSGIINQGSEENLAGRIVKVKITKAKDFGLEGEIEK